MWLSWGIANRRDPGYIQLNSDNYYRAIKHVCCLLDFNTLFKSHKWFDYKSFVRMNFVNDECKFYQNIFTQIWLNKNNIYFMKANL